MEKITPIIVIGQTRSGTKWLSNTLSNHKNIISARYERGGGIQETNMFDWFPMAFGDLTFPDNYIALIECWSNTDLFKIVNANKEYFYKLKPRPVNYFQIFRILMDNFAMENNKKFWLQKASPLSGMDCVRHFSDGHIIVIKRNIIDTLRSRIKLHLNKGNDNKRILREVFFYCYYDKILNKILINNSIISISFEDLKKNLKEEISRICNLIGLEYYEEMLHITFSKNTSFKSDSEKHHIFNDKDINQIRLFYSLLKILPLSFFSSLHNMFKKKTPLFIPGTFGLIKDKYEIT